MQGHHQLALAMAVEGRLALALAGMHAQGRDRGVEAVRIVFDEAGAESGHREQG
jgi:hypothetical protein